MEVSRVKTIRLGNDNSGIPAVALTVRKYDSPGKRRRAEGACQAKALARIVAEKKGVLVADCSPEPFRGVAGWKVPRARLESAFGSHASPYCSGQPPQMDRFWGASCRPCTERYLLCPRLRCVPG